MASNGTKDKLKTRAFQSSTLTIRAKSAVFHTANSHTRPLSPREKPLQYSASVPRVASDSIGQLNERVGQTQNNQLHSASGTPLQRAYNRSVPTTTNLTNKPQRPCSVGANLANGRCQPSVLSKSTQLSSADLISYRHNAVPSRPRQETTQTRDSAKPLSQLTQSASYCRGGDNGDGKTQTKFTHHTPNTVPFQDRSPHPPNTVPFQDRSPRYNDVARDQIWRLQDPCQFESLVAADMEGADHTQRLGCCAAGHGSHGTPPNTPAERIRKSSSEVEFTEAVRKVTQSRSAVTPHPRNETVNGVTTGPSGSSTDPVKVDKGMTTSSVSSVSVIHSPAPAKPSVPLCLTKRDQETEPSVSPVSMEASSLDNNTTTNSSSTTASIAPLPHAGITPTQSPTQASATASSSAEITPTQSPTQSSATASSSAEITPTQSPTQASASAEITPTQSPTQASASAEITPTQSPTQASASAEITPTQSPTQASASAEITPTQSPTQASATASSSPSSIPENTEAGSGSTQSQRPSVTSVTTQISAIHLTKERSVLSLQGGHSHSHSPSQSPPDLERSVLSLQGGHSHSPSPSQSPPDLERSVLSLQGGHSHSPSQSPPDLERSVLSLQGGHSHSPSQSPPDLEKEQQAESPQLSSPESDGDGMEDEVPDDELENDCGGDDDDGSDCSSMSDASSTASMPVRPDSEGELKPALVPSMFPLLPPTLYFSTANQRVEPLPPEQRKLLKWKMSAVTPAVVKHTIARSHFKIGRKDRLWRNLSKMQAQFGKREFSFFPRSFPASARGIGIQVIHKWSQMPRKRPLLVQKYLHKPYLISGNKFDLRIYVYVSSYDPLRVYVFQDGLVRFASKNSEYQSNDSDKACQGHKCCHELFGFDVMLDENLKPWVLEVNISPSLHSNTALDVAIKGQMIRDVQTGLLPEPVLRRPDPLNPLVPQDPLNPLVPQDPLNPLVPQDPLNPLVPQDPLNPLVPQDPLNPLVPQDPLNPLVPQDPLNPLVPQDPLNPLVPQDPLNPLVPQDPLNPLVPQDPLNPLDSSSILDVMTPEDVRVLAETEDELSRKGEFERVFPSHCSSRYLRFFEHPRYLNILLNQSRCAQGFLSERSPSGYGGPCTYSEYWLSWSKSTYVPKFDYPTRQEPIRSSRCSSVVVGHRTRSQPDPEEYCFNGEVQNVTTSLPDIGVLGSPSPSPSLRVWEGDVYSVCVCVCVCVCGFINHCWVLKALP
ncbi:unnamed protein product [Coregonus sp. 'balchen']|nr:unnamed protein product [Coregonus sp. 'balchen']